MFNLELLNTIEIIQAKAYRAWKQKNPFSLAAYAAPAPEPVGAPAPEPVRSIASPLERLRAHEKRPSSSDEPDFIARFNALKIKHPTSRALKSELLNTLKNLRVKGATSAELEWFYNYACSELCRFDATTSDIISPEIKNEFRRQDYSRRNELQSDLDSDALLRLDSAPLTLSELQEAARVKRGQAVQAGRKRGAA